MLQQLLILATALCAGLLEALLVCAAPAFLIPERAWAVTGGFCLTLAGTFAAHHAGLQGQAWARRVLCGAAVGMLAHGLGSACVVMLRGTNQAAGPLWLVVAAPILAVIGVALGSLLVGADNLAGHSSAGAEERV